MLEFTPSTPLTLGVELELQIVNRRDYNLTRGASDLMELVHREPAPAGEIKPEITEGMIEISTGIHHDVDAMLAELASIRAVLLRHADRLNLGLCGGGAHPFQQWPDQEQGEETGIRHRTAAPESKTGSLTCPFVSCQAIRSPWNSSPAGALRADNGRRPWK
jgi:hypothetical protein